MSKLTDVGTLMYLYIDYIEPKKPEASPDFLVTATARSLQQYGDRNWLPLLVKEIGEDQYQILGDDFLYQVAKAAGLKRLWCIIADNSAETANIIDILTQQQTPKINLCNATETEIKLALEKIKVSAEKINPAAKKIAQADRKNWQNFEPILDLKCGINKKYKFASLEEVFYCSPVPEITAAPPQEAKIESRIVATKGEEVPVRSSKSESEDLSKLNITQLKNLCKQRKLKNYSSLNKAGLIKLLTQKTLDDFLD